jgi:hypothetical protein
MTTLNGQILDRRIPTDWKHVEKYPMRATPLAAPTAMPMDVLLNIPRQYRTIYDQGQEGACVGFSQSWMMSILNRMKYHAPWLYHEAQLMDEFTDTPPEAGTSLRAGFDVLRIKGHQRLWGSRIKTEDPIHGIVANRWAQGVDEIRVSLAAGVPVNLGINWYRQFSNPQQKERLDDLGRPIVEFGIQRYDWWIGIGTWGPIDGGHAITCIGYDDRRQAFALCNTWGLAYPFIVWIPYVSLRRLLAEEGEAGIVTDR